MDYLWPSHYLSKLWGSSNTSAQQLNTEESVRDEADSIENEVGKNYKWDDQLQLSNDDFGKEIRKDNEHYDQDAAKKNPFPTDYLLAKFSELAYHSKGYKRPDGWEILTTAYNDAITNGYFGVAFWNPNLCHVVLAHRGTDWKVFGALKSDAELALNKEKTQQSQSAVTFAYLISEEIKKKVKSENIHIQLSITGHSLGAWLAQITTFAIKYFKRKDQYFVGDEDYLENIHAHTVVFDSPGCEIALTKMRKRFAECYGNQKNINYDSLDMTVYLNEPNFINSVNGHVGTIYLTRSWTHTIVDVLDLFDDNYKRDKERVLSFPKGKFTSFGLLVRRFGFYRRRNKCIQTKQYVEDEHSLNVFSEKELHFVYNWYFAANIQSSNIKQLQNQYMIPSFKMDHFKNVFSSEKLIETIGSIKNLRPTGDLIFRRLHEGEQDTILYEQLKWKNKEYSDSKIWSWNHYYFKDIYNLKTFLKSKNRLLHIYVELQDYISLEMNIFCNVLQYYQENKFPQSDNYFSQDRYGFLMYDAALCKMIHSKIFHKHEVNLLIIDWGDANYTDIEIISQLLETDKTIKIVIISLESWNAHNFKGKSETEEVAGYGRNIQFQHLLKCSQDKLLTENKLSLYDQTQKSLKEVVEEDSFFANKVLLELLLKPPADNITIPFQDNTFINAVWFLDLYCEITENLKYDEQLQYIIEDGENDCINSSVLSVFNKPCEPIKVQGKQDFELHCNNSQKIAYLFKIDNEKLILTNVFNHKFYMPRYVNHTKIVRDTMFNDNEDEDLYYFCGNYKEFERKLAQSSLTDEQKERFQFKRKVDMHRLKKMPENVHLFRVEKSNQITQITWLYSNRQVNFLRKHITLAEDFISEQKLMSNDNIVIVSGGAGMGKSSMIGSLYEYYKRENCWVFALPLGKAAFNELSGENTFDVAARFILKSCDISTSSFITCLLSHCLKKNRTDELPIYLFFDAYDEIYNERDRKRCLNLLKFLNCESSAKILITTRKFRSEELENRLLTFASSLKDADYNTEIQTFFTEFWYTQQRLFEIVKDSRQLKKFTTDLFKHIEDSIGSFIFNFKAIPLYTRMLAEILTPKDKNPTFSEQIVVNNVPELYEKYIRIHYSIYFRRTHLTENVVQQIWLLESISKRLRKLAVEKLTMNLISINLKELEELNKIGLIQSRVDSAIDVNIINTNFATLEFLHESFRDYFVAEVLKLWLECDAELYQGEWDIAEFMISDFFMKSEYKDIRFFLNAQIKIINFSSKQLLKCQKRFKKLGTNALESVSGESVFHVCVKEKLYFLVKYFLFKILDEIAKSTLLSVRNLETPLYCVIKTMHVQSKKQSEEEMLSSTLNDQSKKQSEEEMHDQSKKQSEQEMISSTLHDQSEKQPEEEMLSIFLDEIYQWEYNNSKKVLLATTCTYFMTDEDWKLLEEYSSNYTGNEKLLKDVFDRQQDCKIYITSCIANQYEDLEEILKNLQSDAIAKHYLWLRTNENQETGLHLTENEKIAKLLLDNGAYKNLKDNHGLTPLNRAIKKELTNIALTLIQDKVKTNIGDNLGYTPLICAAKYNNLEVLDCLLNSQYTSNMKINQTTVYKVTALMIATRYGNLEIVKSLLRNGADVNVEDINGMNVVHYAVTGGIRIGIFKKTNAKIINHRNQNGVTPLLYSIQKGKWPMVNSLLDNGADVSIGSNNNIFPVELLRQKGKFHIIKKIDKMEKQRKERKRKELEVSTARTVTESSEES